MENLLILATYINDITSIYYDDRIFEVLHQDILHFCDEKTTIFLTGDFNRKQVHLMTFLLTEILQKTQ